jgi:hypothetical protein
MALFDAVFSLKDFRLVKSLRLQVSGIKLCSMKLETWDRKLATYL